MGLLNPSHLFGRQASGHGAHVVGRKTSVEFLTLRVGAAEDGLDILMG